MELNYTLLNHPKAYEVSCNEALAFPFRSPYAGRHWEQSKTAKEQFRMGHKIIAIVEYIPLVGALASLIERVTVYALKNLFKARPDKKKKELNPLQSRKIEPIGPQSTSSSSPTASDPTKSSMPEEKTFPEEKMLKNLVKSVKEHKLKVEESELAINRGPQQALQFKFQEHEIQGLRSNMEDAHFKQELEQGTLIGVFDGHGDEGKVADLACDKFKKNFASELAKNPKDIRKAFTAIIDQIHTSVIGKRLFGGTTAVISFIDKNTNIIYTATLADSEAKIYRKVGKDIVTIPLSCVRHWAHPKEAARAAIAMKEPSIANEWPKADNPKYLRLDSGYLRINISRSIGDIGLDFINGKPGLIQKPKITMHQMKPGDLLIVACDGLWDYTTEEEFKEKVIAPALGNPEVKVAEKACELSLQGQRNNRRGDNVTVVAAFAS